MFKMFELVSYDSLVANKKYLLCHYKDFKYSGIFKGTCKIGLDTCIIFYIRGQNVNYTKDKNLEVFEPKKQDIQNAMERRAVNILLRTILNDPYFQW